MHSFIKKYQPEKLNEFGLKKDTYDFVNTLMDVDKLNILFVGDPDAGKTTLLKCLIKEYYKGYSEKEYEGNIISLNSAQEQGIHFYRNEVKTFCQTCSIIKKKKKIVIIDDLDLINQQSQQVFRNCIDNYKNNVHFICSCTNLKKIIESIQSRLIIVKIPSIDINKLNEICKKIITNENIIIKDESFNLFYKYCENSLRIMINYLEKFKLYNNTIDNDVINSLCTNINDTIFDTLIEYIKNKKLKLSISLLKNIYNQGYSVMDILDCFFSYAKMTNNLTDEEKYKIIPYICKYIHIFHDIHEDEIELPLFINNIIKLI
jgi:DNA polymerase III delta prime subunit